MPRRDKLKTIRTRKILYEEQDRRCKVCDLERDWRPHYDRFYLIEPEGEPPYVICHKCWADKMGRAYRKNKS